MNIKNTQVFGFEAAIRGMRNPMASWERSDSCIVYLCTKDTNYNIENFLLGNNDLILAQRLIKSGSPHDKFLRQIHVWADFTMPRYWWSEMDTYHYNTKDSESTMHKLLSTTKEFTLDLFVYDENTKEFFEGVMKELNQIRIKYLQSKDNKLLAAAKRILPEGYLQMRTLDSNYAEVRNIYHQRKNHRLKEEWQNIYCEWVETLPYAREFILFG